MPARLAKITQPTLVATGGIVDPRMDEAPAGFFHEAGDAVAAAIAHAERRTVEAQGHMADPTALAPMLERFFRF